MPAPVPVPAVVPVVGVVVVAVMPDPVLVPVVPEPAPVPVVPAPLEPVWPAIILDTISLAVGVLPVADTPLPVSLWPIPVLAFGGAVSETTSPFMSVVKVSPEAYVTVLFPVVWSILVFTIGLPELPAALPPTGLPDPT